MADVNWHGDAAMDHVRKRAVGWLNRAAQTISRRAKFLLQIPGTAVSLGRARGGKGRKGSRVLGAVRSRPGEPPRKQTGRLMDSVTYEVDEQALEARVGTNVKYGKALELGTRRGLAPRPWLRRALAESRDRVMSFLGNIGGGG